jgi:hypothetical protein
MRRLLATVAVIAFAAACTPPAQQQTDRPNAPSGPQVQACNEVAPDARRQIGIDDETIVAAAASDLRGGAITPGTYDLTRAMTGASSSPANPLRCRLRPLRWWRSLGSVRW